MGFAKVTGNVLKNYFPKRPQIQVKMLVKYLILCYSESMDFFSRMILDILIAITCSFTTQ